MAYLRLFDYYQNIQSQQLDQLTGGLNSLRLGAELTAIEEAESYLKQKYITKEEFTDTTTWSPAIAYNAKNRVYLDATAYSATLTYVLNALVLQASKVYICTTAIVAPEAFNASKWTELGAQNDIFYVTVPNPDFDYMSIYKVGDKVFYKDKVYTALLSSPVYGHDVAIQYSKYENLPYINVWPDDVTNGAKYWGVGVAYTVLAGTLPTDTAKWTAGDNRSQKIVDCIIDIAIYKLNSRIAPNNIPILRADNYDSAIEWFKACAKGIVYPPLPTIQPKSGRRVRYGGNVKNINSY